MSSQAWKRKYVGSSVLTHVMKDQQQNHGKNRLLVGSLETLDLFLDEQGS